MKRITKAALAATLALGATAAQAQVLTLSTTNPGGLAHSVGTAIAKAVTETTDLRMVVVPAGGSPMPAVAGGEAECGINIAYDLAYYVNGSTYYAKDGAHPGLRMVAAVLPSQLAMYVRKDSDINSVEDLRGKRVPSELNAQLAIGAVYETFLKLGGLTRDDVTSIPAQSIVQAAEDFSTGRNDTFAFSIGTAKVLEVDSPRTSERQPAGRLLLAGRTKRARTADRRAHECHHLRHHHVLRRQRPGRDHRQDHHGGA